MFQDTTPSQVDSERSNGSVEHINCGCVIDISTPESTAQGFNAWLHVSILTLSLIHLLDLSHSMHSLTDIIKSKSLSSCSTSIILKTGALSLHSISERDPLTKVN